MTPLDHAFIKAYSHDAGSRATAVPPQLDPVPLSEALPDDSADELGAGDSTVAPAEPAPAAPQEVVPAASPTPVADGGTGQEAVAGSAEPEDSPAGETPGSEPAAVVATPDPPETGVADATGGRTGFCPRIPTLEDLGLPAAWLRRDGPQGGPGKSFVPEPHAPFPPGDERGRDTGEPIQPPAWHVGRFVLPDICLRLTQSADREIQRLGDGLRIAATNGRKVVGLGATCRGAGCTTLVLCAARSIARQGLRTVLVEGDFSDPQLAVRLGLAPEIGFEDVLTGDVPLAEGLIESDEDRFTVLPLVGRLSAASFERPADSRRIAAFDELRRGYDLVIVDLGTLESPETASPLLGPKLTADVVLVHDRRRGDRRHGDQARRHLAAVGAAQLGIVENFVAG